jgi:hypothetical protein
MLVGGHLMAAPTELNFQGVLLDSSSNGVMGTRAMTVKLYDAAIGGNLLYTEDLGNVAVNKGVYSFNFGTNGIGNGLITETVATTDGATMTYQKIVSASNVITGTVSVADGIYSWNQTNGSSNSDEFGVSYSTSLRRITVTYYNGAPAAGKILTVNYRSPGGGINGVLDGITQPWVEIAVAGVTQATRQKILSVPFAVVADKLTDAGSQAIITSLRGELASIYGLLASVVAGGCVTTNNLLGSPTTKSQVEIFNSTNGVYNSLVSTTSSKSSGGLELNKLVTLDNRTRIASFPNPVTYTINDKIRYLDFSAGGGPGGFSISYLFTYADGTSATVTDTQWYYGFRIANPFPEKTVTTLRRDAPANSFGGYINLIETYRSLNQIEAVVKLNSNLSSSKSFYVGYGLDKIGGDVSAVQFELLTAANAVLATSTNGFLSTSGGSSELRVRLKLTPAITNTKDEPSIIRGMTIMGLP